MSLDRSHLSWRGVGPVAGSGCSGGPRHPGPGCSWPAALTGAPELSEPGACVVGAGCPTRELHPRLSAAVKEGGRRQNVLLFAAGSH